MILESLCELARREGLIDQPAFQSVPVRWIIDLDEQGRFLTLDDTGYTVQEEGKRKPKQEFKRMSVPRRTVRPGQVTKPEFLVDNAQYILGIQTEGADAKKIPMETYRRSFLDLMLKAKTAVDSPILNGVIAFLGDDEQRSKAAADLHTQRFASNEWITFRMWGEFLHDSLELRNWWARQKEETSDRIEKRQCLICGQIDLPTRLHDSIKLPGAVTSGVPLVSFNERAFEKYGLSGNENAPVCRACMVAYVNALRRCLDDKYPDQRDGGTFPQQSVRLSNDTTALYWDDQSSKLTGMLWWLNNERPSAVKALLQAAWKGERPAFPKARFYCLILTGAQGRAAVRGMHTSTVDVVANNVDGYFKCIEAVSSDGEPTPIYKLLKSLAIKEDLKHLPPGLAAEVFLSAVLGTSLSERFIAMAAGRNRAECKVTWPRAALIHLYFQRHKDPEMRRVPMSLDVNSLSPAYRYGRLLAILESLQYSAHKKRVNSTIVDRFYGAASTRPATVFPGLLQLAQNHLKQSSSSGFYKDQIAEIIQGLDGDKGFVPMLNIKEQGVFALGYFHQRAAQPKSSKTDNSSIKENNDLKENEA